MSRFDQGPVPGASLDLKSRETIGDAFVTRINIFIMRAVLGVVFAVVLARVFRPEFSPVVIGLFAIFLVGMAYLLEIWRERKTRK